MDNRSKRWCSFFFFTILLVGTIYASMPSTKAEDTTLHQKAAFLTTEVLGFDTTKYTANIEGQDMYGAYLDLPQYPKYHISYTLKSDEDSFRLYYQFVNSTLQMISIYKDGVVEKEPKSYTNDVFVAKNFLSKYQNYVADSSYDHMFSILSAEAGVGGNFTVTSGNMLFTVLDTDDTTQFSWIYTDTDVESCPKWVTIGVKNGILQWIVDYWQLYSVGSTSVNFSKDEVIDIALEAARNHFWSLGVNASSLSVENFNASNVRWSFLAFMGSVRADNVRSENPLEIYPVWQFGIALVKWHGHMYGAEIGIWADTGEVRRIQEAWSMMLPDDPNSANPSVEPSPSPSVEPSPSPSSSSSSGSSSNSIGKSGSASSAGGLSVPAVGIQLDAGDGRRSDGGSEPVAMVDHHETVNTALGDDAPIDIPLTFAVVIFGILVVGVCVYLVLRKRDQP